MSNRSLLVLLTVALAVFVGLAIRDLLSGPYGGFGAVLWFVPIPVILSFMVAIVLGLRRRK